MCCVVCEQSRAFYDQALPVKGHQLSAVLNVGYEMLSGGLRGSVCSFI